jgi:hypothetical protein
MAKSAMKKGEKKSPSAPRLGVTFHRTFSLNRPVMSQVLSLSIGLSLENKDESRLERKVIRELTNLGTIHVEAMPRYCFGAGLLESNYSPTIFGKFLHEHDSLLTNLSTQWLLHYHFSTPIGSNPLFWHELVSVNFRGGNEFEKDDIEKQIQDFYLRMEGKPFSQESASRTATAFLGTYTKSDGLGGLNLLQQTQQNHYRVNDDLDSPPTWAVAYAIVDFWKKNFPDRQTINLDELTEGNSVANIFMIGAGKVANILQKMQVEGFVDLYRVAPPYQVVLLRPDLQAILEKIYENE